MGCGNSKLPQDVEEPQAVNREEKAKKEQNEADVAAKKAAVELAEFEAANNLANKEKGEHDAALASLNKEKQEAEAAELAALQASGNLDALIKAAAKARSEAETASSFTKSTKEKQANELDAAVIVARKTKEDADAVAEKERLEADEAGLVEEKERLEYEEAARLAAKEKIEYEEAQLTADKEKFEADAAASKTEEAVRLAAIKKQEKAEAAAAAQKARDEAPIYHKGNLMKKGDDMLGSWKTRFFVANNKAANFSIDYFETAGGKKKGTMECSGFKTMAFTAEDVASHGEHGFKLTPKGGGRIWWLKAESKKAQKEWIEVFSRACDMAGVSGDQVVVEQKKK